MTACSNLAVFTSDRAEFLMDVSFQYQLKRDQLKELHVSCIKLSCRVVTDTSAQEKFQMEYPTQIESAATAAIKNTGIFFSLDE